MDKYNNDQLDNFMKAVDSEVEKKISAILTDAKNEKDSAIEAILEEHQNYENERIQAETKLIKEKYKKISAKVELECKKDILIEREKLVSQIFANISDELLKFSRSDSYVTYLANTIKKSNVTEKVELHLRNEDLKYSEDLAKLFVGGCTVVEDKSIKLGGLSFVIDGKTVYIDNTLDTKLSEQRSAFNSSKCFALA